MDRGQSSAAPRGAARLAGLGVGDTLVAESGRWRFDGYSLVDDAGTVLRVYTEVYGTRTFDPEPDAVALAATARVERAVTRESEIRARVELGAPATVEERVRRARERVGALEAALDDVVREQEEVTRTSRFELDVAARAALEGRFVDLDERRRAVERHIETLRVETATLSGDTAQVGETTIYLARASSSVGQPLPEWRWRTENARIQCSLAQIARRLDDSFGGFSFNPVEIVRALTPVREGGSGRALESVLRSNEVLDAVVEGIAMRDQLDVPLATSYSILSSDVRRGRTAGGDALTGTARVLSEVRAGALRRVLEARGIDPETGGLTEEDPPQLSPVRRRVYRIARDASLRRQAIERLPEGATLGFWTKAIEGDGDARRAVWRHAGRTRDEATFARDLEPHLFAFGMLERLWRTHHPELVATPTSSASLALRRPAGLPSWMGYNPLTHPDGRFAAYVGDFAAAEYYTRNPFRSRAAVEAAIAPYARLGSAKTPWVVGSRRVRRGPGAYQTEWFAIVPGISEAPAQRVARERAADAENAVAPESLKKGDRVWSERRKEYVTVVKQCRDNGSKRNFDRVVVTEGGRQTRERRDRLSWLSAPDLEVTVRRYQPIRPRRFELARERAERVTLASARQRAERPRVAAERPVASVARVVLELAETSNLASLVRVMRSQIARDDIVAPETLARPDVVVLPFLGSATADDVRAAVDRLPLRPVRVEAGRQLMVSPGSGPDGADTIALPVLGDVPGVHQALRRELGIDAPDGAAWLTLPVAHVRAGTGERWAREMTNFVAGFTVSAESLAVVRQDADRVAIPLLSRKEIARRLDALEVGAVVEGFRKEATGRGAVWRSGEATRTTAAQAERLTDDGLAALIRGDARRRVSGESEIVPVERLDGPATASPDARVTIFRSGLSRARDFEAFARAGVPVGVQIRETSEATIERIVEANAAGIRVFVDNGAFSAFQKGERVDAAEVFTRYRDLAGGLARLDTVSFVVPDVVGDQTATLALVAEHGRDIRALIEAGADVLVPLQKGALSLAECHARVVELLGTNAFRSALPSNEAAATPDEVPAFVREARPARIHLLGIARHARLWPLLESLYEVAPGLDVSTDANALRSLVGRDRPLGRAIAARLDDESRAAVHDGDLAAGLADETELTAEVYGTPRFLGERQAKQLAALLTTNEGERAAIIHAALAPDSGHAHGSRLGDVLDERYGGQLAEYALWTLFVDDARTRLAARVRSGEITRMEGDSKPGSISKGNTTDKEHGDGDGGSGSSDGRADGERSHDRPRELRVEIPGVAQSAGPAAVRDAQDATSAVRESSGTGNGSGAGLFREPGGSGGAGREPDRGGRVAHADDRGMVRSEGARAMTSPGATDRTSEIEARVASGETPHDERTRALIAGWREHQAKGVAPSALMLDDWAEFTIGSPNGRRVEVLYQPRYLGSVGHIEFRSAKDAGFSETGYRSELIREGQVSATNPVDAAREVLARLVAEHSVKRKRTKAARAAAETAPESGDREAAVREALYRAIADDAALEPGWVKPGAWVVREHHGVDALMRRVGMELVVVPADATRIARVKGLVALRDAAREVVRAEGAGDAEAADTARRKLSRWHDVFVSRYGPMSSTTNVTAYRDDPDASLVLSIEIYDRRLRTFVKGPIFDGPVLEVSPREPVIEAEPAEPPAPSLAEAITSGAAFVDSGAVEATIEEPPRSDPSTSRELWRMTRGQVRDAVVAGRVDFAVPGERRTIREIVAARRTQSGAGIEHQRYLNENLNAAIDVEHTGAVLDARARGDAVPSEVLDSIPSLSGSEDLEVDRTLGRMREIVAGARGRGRRVLLPLKGGEVELDNQSLRAYFGHVEYLDRGTWRVLTEEHQRYLAAVHSVPTPTVRVEHAPAPSATIMALDTEKHAPSADGPGAATPASARPRTTISGSRRLTAAVRELLEQGEAIDNRRLTALADEAFGGSRASGAYTVKDQYDAVEVAANEFVASRAARWLSMPASDALAEIRETVLARLPRQTDGDRTQEQVRFQQFSTPPTLAYLVARALAVREGDVVEEPSAGTGSLAVWARAMGATVHTNELSERRRALLAEMGFAVTGVDAEHLDELLPDAIRPTVIPMNPPFSATAGRVEQNNTKFGFRHLRSALDRLELGGRLVAVLPEGAALDKQRAAALWGSILAEYTLRANIGLPGGEYARYGTRYPNQLVVVDKVGPTPGSTFADQAAHVVAPSVASYEEALDVLELIPERARLVARVGHDAGDAGGGDGGPGAGGDGPDLAARAGRDSGVDVLVAPAGGPGGDGPSGRGGEPGARPLDARPDGAGDGGGGDSPDARAGRRVDEAGVVYTSAGRAARVTEDGGTFASYSPAKIRGARAHPADLVESASMAAVEPPDPTYVPHLAPEIVRDGVLSEVQLERVVYAGQRHEQTLPDGARGGFYLGDGTGVGKGRSLAGIILDNWNQGRRRALWLSVNYDLVSSTDRDLRALGGEVPLHAMNELGYEPLEVGDGVLFSSYSSLIAKSKDGRTRLDQLIAWLGEDGVVVFDEGHKAKNALGTEMGEPTQTGQAVIDLQARLPKARVVYSSATGATEVRNMAYMTRLGLWGPGTAFPGGFTEFLGNIERGGVGAMEMVARDLKALGLYGSASISYKGVDYRESVHELAPAQREIYDRAAEAWQTVLENINDAIGVTNGGRGERSRAMIAFWADHQRFFRQLTTALKVPTAIVEIDRALSEDKSVVVSLIGTGEARTKELVATATERGASLDDLNFAPVELIKNLVRRAFPVIKYEEYTDPASNAVRRRPVVDADGKKVESKAAVRMREELLENLDGLVLPEGPLDQLVNHYGPEKVAELTGRKKRLVYNAQTKRREYMPRLAGVPAQLMNETEMRSFQSGRKRIAIISDAASTGISLHASNQEVNQQRRVHITLELGWSADKQMQTFGRTHRSDQATPPEYVLLATELGGEKRFCSTIARRLASLGALTKGQRDASGAGDLARYNFESPYGEAATQSVFRALERGDVPEDLRAAIGDAHETLVAMGVVARRAGQGPESVTDTDLQNVGRFLNRVLALDVTRQNAVFEMFSRAFDESITLAKQTGLWDEGVADIKALSTKLKTAPTVVHTDETTGARTSHYELTVREETHPVSFRKADYHRRTEREGCAFYVQKRSKNIILAEPAGFRTDAATGRQMARYRVHKPSGWDSKHIVDGDELQAKYEIVPSESAKERWTEQYEADPGYRDRDVHLIGGALLPIWDRMKLDRGSQLRIVRVETDEGERLVGVEIPPKEVRQVLKSVGVSRDARSGEELFRALVEGEVLELVGGLRIQGVPFKGEEAYQIRGLTRYQIDEARRLGALHEQRGWDDFVYVPNDPERGPEILTRFTKQYPELGAEPTAKPDLEPAATVAPAESGTTAPIVAVEATRTPPAPAETPATTTMHVASAERTAEELRPTLDALTALRDKVVRRAAEMQAAAGGETVEARERSAEYTRGATRGGPAHTL